VSPSRDLLHAARRLRRKPGSTLVAAGTLALGLGAAVTLFGLVNGLFLKPLPGVREQRELIKVLPADPERTLDGFTRAEHAALRDGQRELSGLAAFRGAVAGVGAAEDATGEVGELLVLQEVSAEYFPVLGAEPARGRFILEEDTTGSGRPVVVISHRLRSRLFPAGVDPLGRVLSLRGEPHTVVGVASPGFGGTFVGFVADLWIPLPETGPGGAAVDGLELVGRLGPGVELERAAEVLTALGSNLPRSARPEEPLAVRVTPETGFDESLEGAVAAFSVLLLTVGLLVLGVACFNVANLLLARATERQREMSVRAALGAGRGRLVRQLLTESLLLAALAALGGWGLSLAGLRVLEGFSPRLGELTLRLDLSPDLRVLAFTVLVALAATLAATLLPALRAAHPRSLARLRGGARGERTSRAVAVLLVAQVAVTVVLLAATSLFVRSLQQAGTRDPGFDADRVLAVTLRTPDGEPADEATRRLHHRLEESLAALPGVRQVSRVVGLPLAPRLAGRATVPLEIDGVPPPVGQDAWRVETGQAAPGYFEVMGIARLHGRDFSPADDETAPAAVVVNRAFAGVFFPGVGAGSLPGREVVLRDRAATIVGVVEDSKTGRLDEEPRPYVYRAVDQEPGRTVTFVLRTTGEPAGPMLQVREMLRREAPGQLVLELAPMPEVIRGALLPQRWAAAVSGLLGTVGLLLAMVGVAAMLSYGVSRRRREIGIRLALGAEREDVLREVLGSGLRLAGWGLALGLPAALGVTRLLSSFLVGVSPADPLAYAGVVVVLTVAVLPALWLPARRTLGIEPRTVLAAE
jgi:predicted permease